MAQIYEHTLFREELDVLFPEGYKEVTAEIYKRLSFIPQTFIVDGHHVHVYASKKMMEKSCALTGQHIFSEIALPPLL